MEEKLRFVFEYERVEESMKALCNRFEISRETGYVWLRRFRQLGVEGLVELNGLRSVIPTRRRQRSKRRCWIFARRI